MNHTQLRDHRLSCCVLAAMTAAAAVPLSAQAPPQPGNITVLRVGDNSGTRTSSATKCFLDVYDAAGNLIAKFPLPDVPATEITLSGTATDEGLLTLSADNQYLVCGGYRAAPGVANVSTSTSAAVPRVVARIDMTGSIDTTTTLGTAFSGASIRSVASTDGLQFHATGSAGGVQYATFGASSATQINSAPPLDPRVADIFAGQLYVSAASGSFQGIATVGSGVPTTSGQVPALLSGFPTSAGPSSQDFHFADASTVYVADDRPAASGGGIQKWTESGGTWSLQYTLAVSATDGCRGLTGHADTGLRTLYATTTGASPTTANNLVRVVDTGPTATFTVVATSNTNTVFRGVRYIPYPSTFVVSGTGSPSSGGVPTIASIGLPRIGTAWGVSGGNWPPLTVGWLVVTVGPLLPGVPIPGAQPGALLYAMLPETLLLLTFADGGGNVAQIIPDPANPAFLGLQAGCQWFVFDATLPYPLQFATSPGGLVTVGT